MVLRCAITFSEADSLIESVDPACPDNIITSSGVPCEDACRGKGDSCEDACKGKPTALVEAAEEWVFLEVAFLEVSETDAMGRANRVKR